MKTDLPAYCYARVRRGVTYIYYERRGNKPVRIHHKPGTPEFAATYARLLSGPPQVSSKRNFAALVRSYNASKRYQDLAPRTKLDYDKVTEWVTRKLGPLPVAGMQRKDVIRARDANADTLRFANYIVQVLRILMEHAINLGWRDSGTNPAKGVELLKSERPERDPWPDDLVAAYRATATGRALLIFELCIGTGQRIGDVLKMRWDHIDAGGINVTQGKTKARLWIPMTPRLATVLDATPRVGLTICAWERHGRPTSYRGAADLVMKARKAIGAEAYDLHSLRYTTAAELAEAGCSDDLIKAITGHTTGAMVAKYAGPARQKARAILAQDSRK